MKVKLKNKKYKSNLYNPCIDTEFEKEGEILTKLNSNENIKMVCVRWDNGYINFYELNDLIFLSGENKKDNFNSIW